MPTPTSKKNLTPSKLTVDFSNVEDRREGKKADHVPSGDYLLKVVGCERKKKQDGGTYYLNWYLEIVSPKKYKGKHIYHVTSLIPENLWSLRNFLMDLGIKVPKGSVDVPLAAIVKKQPVIGATLEDDDYTNDSGKTTTKSKIAATFPKGDFSETAGSSKSSSDDEDEDEDEDTDEEEEDDEEELDVDEL